MPDEYLLVNSAATFLLFDLLKFFFCLGGAVAIGKDIHSKSKIFSIRRDDQVADIERQISYLLCLAAFYRDAPDLRRAGTRGQEINAVTIGCPAGIGIRFVVRGQSAKVSAISMNEPEVGSAFVCFEVGFAQDKDNVFAVGRNLWVGEPFHRQHIIDGKRMG